MSDRRTAKDLLLILLLALAVRAVRIAFFTPIVEGDGTEYCRLAENLAAGKGYFGMLEGRELMFPPLYALAIAAVLRVVPALPTPLAARFVSLIAGLVLVALLHHLAARRAGRGAALLTGGVAALLPAFVLTSAAAFGEALFAVFFVLALVPLERCFESRRIRDGALAGAALGLAYLVRVETLAIALLATLVVLSGFPFRGAPARRPFAAGLALAATFVLVASPYVAYLHDVTGQFCFEGKSGRVFATIDRYAAGLPYATANYALGAEGEELGPWLSPNAKAEGHGALATITRAPAAFFAHYAANLARVGTKLVFGPTISSGPLLLLALAGLVLARERTRGRVALDLFLVGVVAYAVLVTALYKVVVRYLFPVGLVATLLLGEGAIRLHRRLRSRFGAKTAHALVFGLIALCFVVAARGIPGSFGEFDEAGSAQSVLRDAGRAILATAGREAVVMSDDPRIAYYACATWTPLPVAPTETVLINHARERRVGFLALAIPPDERPIERPGRWFDPKAPPVGLRILGSFGTRRLYVVLPR